MEVGGLESAVRALQVAVASLSREEERARELGALLEQRVRILEQGSRGEPVPEKRASSAPVPAPEPPVLEEAAPETLAANADKGREAEGGADELEYSIGESLWDAPLVIGLPGMSWGSSALLFLSLVMNATVQVFLCLAIITSEDFVHPNRYKDLEGPMRRWRFTSAHDNSMVDAKHTSLVSRVCGGDLSLSVANKQADLLVEINSYLALDDTAVERRSFGPGPLLCVVCIFLFAVVVARELRCLAVSAGAALSVRRGATAVEEGRLAALSSCRLACFLAAGLVRVGIALALALAGTMWLSTTTSTTDLILNAAALGFILDLDECLYETTVPADVRAFVRGLGALKHRRSRWHLEAVVPLLAICLVALLSAPLVLEPNISEMMGVKRELCAGSLEFASAKNPAGYVIVSTTEPFEDGPELKIPDLQERANKERAFSATGRFSMKIPEAYFQQFEEETLGGLAGRVTGPCQDVDNAAQQEVNSHLFAAARYEVRIHEGESTSDRPFRCSDYASKCQSSGLLRYLCPETCGCGTYTSGLFQGSVAQGCPVTCEAARQELVKRRQNATCADEDVAANAQWAAYWATFKSLMQLVSAGNDVLLSFYDRFVDKKLAEGCSNTERDPYYDIDFCRAQNPMMSANGWTPVIGFCPASCCRGSNPPQECPRSCRTTQR
mmetsp:Transcript_104236/g.321562  ORF Transcript_104236/g.321562 Transcript_104236/m.321562 type:complete len:670 (-) Transcript_104236:67-2076(-)